ncbi:MAG: hypothetical protein P8Z35_12185 [Ignavibacteriaceae bacterium]
MQKAARHKNNCLFLLNIILFLIKNPILYAQEDQKLITKIDSSLQRLITIQREVKDIHPYLNSFNPIAIYEKDSLYIFDINSAGNNYEYKKKIPVPFPMPERIRASFPLEDYSGKPVCIVTKDIFKSLNGYITIFHEFIHCRQFLTVESQLKNHLEIAKEATKKNNYSWEITYPFPYADTIFVNNYSSFVKAADGNDFSSLVKYRNILKEYLKLTDYEYMVWEEWKEGFARLIENKIRRRYNLNENTFGSEKPYNRITFYYGGEKYIKSLINNNPVLFSSMKDLFYTMLDKK